MTLWHYNWKHSRIYYNEVVSGQLPSKKIVSWFGLGFGLGLELELGLGRGEAGNFPRWQLSHLQVIIHKLYKSKYKSKCSKTHLRVRVNIIIQLHNFPKLSLAKLRKWKNNRAIEKGGGAGVCQSAPPFPPPFPGAKKFFPCKIEKHKFFTCE